MQDDMIWYPFYGQAVLIDRQREGIDLCVYTWVDGRCVCVLEIRFICKERE